MRLVRQTRLRSVRGTTTSVFEVDMCEVGSGAFVVNFRFGKKGKRFTEGTKTTRPVGRDEAERIFLMFERLHNREDYPGNGVGLAVCQQIVQVHGGTIWATSTPGEGSCFYFRLINA